MRESKAKNPTRNHVYSNPSARRFHAAVQHAAHLLPAQGPITVFIHHNTLHAFEDRRFDEAVKVGAEVFDCEPFLSESRYREALETGRIRFSDLRAELEDELGARASESVAGLCSRLEFRSALLQYPFVTGTGNELRWLMAETDALRRVRSDASAAARGRLLSETRHWVMRDLRSANGGRPKWVDALFSQFRVADIESWSTKTWEAFSLEALWRICLEGARRLPAALQGVAPKLRHRDLLTQASGVDVDPFIHSALGRFTAAFCDQGVSHWPLPRREMGFFRSFCAYYADSGGPPDRWLRGLGADAQRLLQTDADPVASACASLEALGVPEREWDEYVSQTLLAIRGWAGIVHQLEARGDRIAHPAPPGAFVEFVAVRMLLERHAIAWAASDALGDQGPLAGLRERLRQRIPPPPPTDDNERAFPFFQLAQALGWSPADLHRLGDSDWSELQRELTSFSSVERRRVFHLAYERRFREQCLNALTLHEPRRPTGRPRFQVVTCLDEREESFRRWIEEVAPEAATFGTAGFFAVPMYYRGVADANFVPLCPIVLTPDHWVEERPLEELEDAHARAAAARRWLGAVTHWASAGSRAFAVGAVISSTLGLLASVPLLLRILFPRLTPRLRGDIRQLIPPVHATSLTLERNPLHGSGPQPARLGFTLEEMANLAERLLRDIGLVADVAPLAFLLGHGSSSLNNPHKSAYDCGACGGSPGGPNARAAAEILNDQRVRAKLAERGIVIEKETHFVGGCHNTCDDSLTLYDLDAVPMPLRDALKSARDRLEFACENNARERCRRFQSAPLSLTPAESRRHVEGRSEDLAQTRPELGHATNALCVVGRRERTRGLFLDRRAFLASYDPTIDPEGAPILTRTLQAVFPVCGGINLEYYFSHVDSVGYGCGTKLPHNVTSLLGVMDGAQSDLRTGLPWQMVEIHEPVRLLIVCETTPETMLDILNKNPSLGSLANNEWIQLAVLDPHSPAVRVYENGEFHPYAPTSSSLPSAPSSFEWHRGWRDHLEFAEIIPADEGVIHA